MDGARSGHLHGWHIIHVDDSWPKPPQSDERIQNAAATASVYMCAQPWCEPTHARAQVAGRGVVGHARCDRAGRTGRMGFEDRRAAGWL